MQLFELLKDELYLMIFFFYIADFHSNLLKMLRRIEEIKLKSKRISMNTIRKIDTTESFSLKFRDPKEEPSDYEVVIEDEAEPSL